MYSERNEYVAGSLYIGCGGHWRNNTYSWVVVEFYFQTIRNSPVKQYNTYYKHK